MQKSAKMYSIWFIFS